MYRALVLLMLLVVPTVGAQPWEQPPRDPDARLATAIARTQRLTALAEFAAKSDVQPLQRPEIPRFDFAHLPQGPVSTTAPAATFTVNSVADGTDATVGDGVCDDGGGTCTLRAALEEANATTAADEITFAIGGGGLATITLVTQLPDITQPVLIDGVSQNCGTGTCVALDGGGTVEVGLMLTGAETTVRGLAVGGFTQVGLVISGQAATDNQIEGCYLGVALDGETPFPNTNGLLIREGASGNLITGSVLSGNVFDGLFILGEGTDNNTVEDSFIGTDAGGSLAVGNGQGGVLIANGASNNELRRSVVSANGFDGVFIDGEGTERNRVVFNRIGTDVTGTQALGNVGVGVLISQGASFNTIGPADNGERNLISGNEQDGVFIQGAGTTGNEIAGNYIGTDINGTTALPNRIGVFVGFGATETAIGLDGATIGFVELPNVISGNLGHGVFMAGNETTNNRVEGNFIGTDPSGTQGVANRLSGVFVSDGCVENVVGGSSVGARNIISGNVQAGVLLSGLGALRNRVEGNYIGTDITGTVALGNAQGGVALVGATSANIIGGTPEARNIISGNGLDGIAIGGLGTRENQVAANYIGTDHTGTQPLGNAGFGVLLTGGGVRNIIGGTDDAFNLISGNEQDGVVLFAPETEENQVAGNRIGTDATGTAALGNRIGVFLDGGTQHNVVGDNVISGNREDGVFMRGTTTTNNVIENNVIGTDHTGTQPLGNRFSGFFLFDGVNQTRIDGNVIAAHRFDGIGMDGDRTFENQVVGNYIGTDRSGTRRLGNRTGVFLLRGTNSNEIGGLDEDAGNVIAFNLQAGIVLPTSGSGNAILGNRFYGQRFLGIDLLRDGRTPNDTNDADGGPNQLQNAPVLSDYLLVDGEAQLTYVVDSSPDFVAYDGGAEPGLLVEFYRADADLDEGQDLIARDRFTADDFAAGGKTITLGNAEALGLTGTARPIATATDALGNTSEFSLPAALLSETPQLVVTKADELLDDDGDGQAVPGQTVRYIVRLTNATTTATTNLRFSDTVDPNTTLLRESIELTPEEAGLVGFGLEDNAFTVDVPLLEAGSPVEIRFDVVVQEEVTVPLIVNQGSLTADGIPPLLTDNPFTLDVPGDPTETSVFRDENTAVEDASTERPSPTLAVPFPNPFTSGTTVSFAVPSGGSAVRLVVYDVLGREVARLVDGWMPEGHHETRWQAGAHPSGVYFVRLQSGNHQQVRQVIHLP